MSPSSTPFMGMDVHKASIAVADVAQDHGAAVMYLGTMGTRQGDFDPRLRKMPSQATHLLCVYEAGPCGDWLARDLIHTGDDCWVVAPSRLPQKAGDRVTTDRQDAGPLARLAHAGELTAVDVPTVEADARRDRRRAREDAISDGKDAQCRLNGCWLRHAIRDVGRAHWHAAHRRGRSAVVCPTPAPPLVWPADVRAVKAPPERLQRLAQARQEHGTAWRLHPVVEAMQALRGGQCSMAVTMVAAIGDLPRCEHASELMKCLGLIPSDDPSGAPRRQGAMPKAGNPHARRALVEGAWADR